MSSINKHLSIMYDPRTETMKMDTHGGIDTTTALNMLIAAITQLTDQLLSIVPESNKESVRNDLHDKLNYAFYLVLEHLIPTEDVPDFATESIIETQNRMIHEAAQAGMQLPDYLEMRKQEFLKTHPKKEKNES